MKRISLALSFLLLILTGLSIAYWTTKFIKNPERVQKNGIPIQAFEPSGNWGSMFGVSVKNEGPSEITLKGIIWAHSGRDSQAIVSLNNQSGQAVKLNEVFANDWKVTEITASYVQIERAGQSRRLELPASQTPQLVVSQGQNLNPVSPPQSMREAEPQQLVPSSGATSASNIVNGTLK